MVNKAILAERLERLREYLAILETVQQHDMKRFVQDPFIHGAAERYLHLAIEETKPFGACHPEKSFNLSHYQSIFMNSRK